MSILKTCVKCQSTEFYKSGDCKACAQRRASEFRKNNPEKAKQYRDDNKEKLSLLRKSWYEKNKEKSKDYSKDYYSKRCLDDAFKDAAKIRAKKWRENNPGKYTEYFREYADKNKEKLKKYRYEFCKTNNEAIRSRASKWLKENREKANETKRAYRKNNPEGHRIGKHNRRLREKANGGQLSKGISKILFKLQKGKCPCCGKPLGSNFHLDHIIPITLGGANSDSNIQLLRAECNLKKNAIHPVVYMQSRGFLL